MNDLRKKPAIFLVIISVFSIAAIFVIYVQTKPALSNSVEIDGLLLTISLDKHSYEFGEEIKITGSLKNVSDKKISIYGSDGCDKNPKFSLNESLDRFYYEKSNLLVSCTLAVTVSSINPGETHKTTITLYPSKEITDKKIYKDENLIAFALYNNKQVGITVPLNLIRSDKDRNLPTDFEENIKYARSKPILLEWATRNNIDLNNIPAESDDMSFVHFNLPNTTDYISVFLDRDNGSIIKASVLNNPYSVSSVIIENDRIVGSSADFTFAEPDKNVTVSISSKDVKNIDAFIAKYNGVIKMRNAYTDITYFSVELPAIDFVKFNDSKTTNFINDGSVFSVQKNKNER